MRAWHIVRRSLAHYAHRHAAAALACAAACAVVAGSLIVGDSVRRSLRDHALERLGPVGWTIGWQRFFRADLAADLARDAEVSARCAAVVPCIIVEGTVVHAVSRRRAAGVQVVAVDDRFAGVAPAARSLGEGRAAVLGSLVAAEIEAAPGDAILVHFSAAEDLPQETALASRADGVERLRLEVGAIAGAEDGALFALRHQQEAPRNVFVPLSLMERSLERPGGANTLLFCLREDGIGDEAAPPALDLTAAVKRSWNLEDVELTLERDDGRGLVSLESSEFFLSDPVAAAGRRAARAAGLVYLEAMTYLVNTIASGEREIPYSLVTAVGPWTAPDGGTTPAFPEMAAASPAGGSDAAPCSGIFLNSWAMADCGARVGDEVQLTFFEILPGEALSERSATLRIAGVLPLAGAAQDPGWTPRWKGVTNARTFSDWNVPFALDRRRIRDVDEAYWNEHKTTPKAFLPLECGRELWSSRYGGMTSIRLRPARVAGAPADPPQNRDLERLASDFRREMLSALEPEELGWRLMPVRAEALVAASGSTDFAALFLALSSFLIISSLALAWTSFGLAYRSRSREQGLLRAVGLSAGELRRLLLAEGLSVGAAGVVIGAGGGVVYAASLVFALRYWWSDAVSAPFLALSVSLSSIAIAAVSTLIAVAGTVAIVAHEAARTPPGRLLAGSHTARDAPRRTGGSSSLKIAAGGAILGAACVAASFLGALPPVISFVLAGLATFLAGLALLSWWLRQAAGRLLGGAGPPALIGLGALNARRAPARSLLTTGLIGAATFVVVSVAASRRDPASAEPELASANGGFALHGRSASPIFSPLESERGGSDLALAQETASLLGTAEVRVFAFRERPGDETSCLNLYAPREPRVLGAPRGFLDRGGFSWAASLVADPWRLLATEDGWDDLVAGEQDVVPAVGDANTVLWILHSGLGKDIEITDGRGRRVRLRFVGLLAHSVLQGALIVSEQRFVDLFPKIGGWSSFLIECPEALSGEVATRLEEDLEPYGLDLRRTGDVLAAYQAVENTYLSTFFALGGLGLALGTIGLGAALLRSVEERRGEIALLRAIGYSRSSLRLLILAESFLLLIAGIFLGTVCAVLATLPNLIASRAAISLPTVALALGAVLLAGILSCAAALSRALRPPVVAALRKE